MSKGRGRPPQAIIKEKGPCIIYGVIYTYINLSIYIHIFIHIYIYTYIYIYIGATDKGTSKKRRKWATITSNKQRKGQPQQAMSKVRVTPPQTIKPAKGPTTSNKQGKVRGRSRSRSNRQGQ